MGPGGDVVGVEVAAVVAARKRAAVIAGREGSSLLTVGGASGAANPEGVAVTTDDGGDPSVECVVCPDGVVEELVEVDGDGDIEPVSVTVGEPVSVVKVGDGACHPA